ncbi:hypothetical protein [Deinococcus hohokamensis]|uniref:Uncharacterized protein n=1 Tax=Deinococcus hohokamensis TaxID=309883 RepID=A0ABV9ID55_9DEIO
MRTRVMLGVMVALLQGAGAIRLPGTAVDYFALRDTVTTDNRSVIRVYEVNDTSGQTYVQFACEARELHASLHGRNPLLSPEARKRELYPLLVYQVDQQQLKTFEVSGISDEAGKGLLDSVAFEKDAVVVEAFGHAVRRVTLRISRLGMSEITLVFAVKGFREALRRIKPC